MKTIIVSDKNNEWSFLDEKIEVISSMDYLQNPIYSEMPALRVINLCRSYCFQSKGYYVSLLAEAREHKVLPSVLTIQDIKNPLLASSLYTMIEDDIQDALQPLKSTEFILSVYFGKNIAKKYDGLCRKLHGLFPMPLFRVHFVKKQTWVIQKIHNITYTDIPESHLNFIKSAAELYYARKRFPNPPMKRTSYDLAILYNPDDPNSPSDPLAIQSFIEAGDELGIHVDVIGKDEIKLLPQYDALFIRETTQVNHYTYRFSRRATSAGLIVMDDPVSILKCANKVYLAEHLKKQNIATPKTTILSKSTYKEFADVSAFPCVLKDPSSAFSLGVSKANSREEFMEIMNEYFKTSDLIIAQEFMRTDFDWRVGILNNQIIFTCRYYMAKSHWQIFNWADTHNEFGGHDCVAIDDVPDIVKQTALKSTKAIGNGLYGVDIKLINDVAYVIEINDNPSIDRNFEDLIEGKKLYTTIMNTFLTRIQQLHNHEQKTLLPI